MTDDTAPALLRQARTASARRDWTTAHARFRAAGATADALATEDLVALARACWWLGRPDEYLALAAEEHRRRLRDGQVARAALTALEIGVTELVRGHEDVGAGWLARARRLFAEVPTAPERGYLLAVDADVATTQGDLTTAAELAGEVLRLGDRHADPTLQAQGLFLTAQLALRHGRPEEGRQRLDEAMLPVRAGEVVPEWAGNLYCRTIQLCHELADLPRAQRWTAATEEWCQGYAPAVLFTGICRVHRVQLLQLQGEWARAEEEAGRAAAELADLDATVAAEAHYQRGEVHRLRGDLDAAAAAYQQAHRCGRDPLPGQALLHLSAGRTGAAADKLDAALTAETTSLRRAPLLAARTEVALARDLVAPAARDATELARIAEHYASPGWYAEARRWQGAVLLARHRPAEAVPVLREARTCWQRLGVPYQLARTRLDLAEAGDALGDHDTAGQERAEAAVLLERLGARRDLARLHSRQRSGPGGVLSPRELEVVVAVADGRTNRAVAEHLSISERTVDRHLANVYRKLDVSSRTGAVAWAREHGLV